MTDHDQSQPTHGAALVRGLADVGIADRPTVGGKGGSLGELAAAGIAVPPGFVVTTGAFEQALAGIDADGSLRAELEDLREADHARIAEVAAGVRERVVAADLPSPLRAAVTGAYEQLAVRGRPAPVAVRSSATSEDSADASFAGLQDTYLWVRGAESVLEHVRRCWASLYNVESVVYRRRQRQPERGLAMAVVVQQMVDARTSGVMFTCSPVTGDRSVVALEATWGLGSAVVSGDVTPDRYVVSKVTGEILERHVSTKLREHRMHPSGTGVLEQDVPADRRDAPSVSDDELRTLVETARRVEDHYGVPQDIEWAIPTGTTGAGLLLLQSRPETVWAARQARPVAAPRTRAFDHVLDLLGRGRAQRPDGTAS